MLLLQSQEQQMFKSAIILVLALWNLHEYIPPVPDPVLGVLFGMFCGLLVVGYMVVVAGQQQRRPVVSRSNYRNPVKRRNPVKQYPASWPLAGQMALQGGAV
jgi:hypothetical protein